MKRTALAAAGAAAIGLGLFAAPAFAGNGYGPGDGTGSGATASGRTTGTCTNLPAMGELTDAQKAALVFWVEEEKVAHDLYVAFDAAYDSGPFERIARSEARHMDAVRVLLERYGLEDPTEGAAAGEFESEELATMYEDLLEQGMASVEDALEVGQAVEIDDLEVLGEMADEVTAPDVLRVLDRQITASERHLTAFGG